MTTLANTTLKISNRFLEKGNVAERNSVENIVDYYREAGPDYQYWSKQFNMHFGYFRFGMNPFNLEQQLNGMNTMVVSLLGLSKDFEGVVLDLGCGLGATARHVSNTFKKLKFIGLTIVPWQIKEGKRLISKEGKEEQIDLIRADYTQIPFENNSVDGAYAIESACHLMSEDKEELLEDAFRVLKPGSTFVFADGCLKKKKDKLNRVMRKAYESACVNWSIGEMANIGLLENKMKQLGFKNVQVIDVSWRVAPSVLHVPFATLKFFLDNLFSAEKISQQSWNNLVGPWMTMLMGTCRSSFGYYIVKGIKPQK